MCAHVENVMSTMLSDTVASNSVEIDNFGMQEDGEICIPTDEKLLLNLIAKLLQISRNAKRREVNESLTRKDKLICCDECYEFKDGENIDVYETSSV